MRLEDILKHNSIKDINEKTRISISNIEKLAQKDFSGLKKVQVLGLISILEREYGGVFDDLREANNEHFGSQSEKVLAFVVPEESSSPESSSSKWLVLFFGLMLLVGIWSLYSYLNSGQSQAVAPPAIEELNATISAPIEVNTTDANTTEANISTDINQTSVAGDTNVSSVVSGDVNSTISGTVSIVPVKRLWFATVDLANKKTADHTLTKSYDLNSTGGVLVATSVAPFSIKSSAGEQKYNDFKPHYFKVAGNVANEITKEIFISSGGPASMTR